MKSSDNVSEEESLKTDIMKICFIVPSDLSQQNAGATHTLELAKNLVKLGHEVFLFSRGLKRGDYSFHYINVSSCPSRILGYTFPLFLLIKLMIHHSKVKFCSVVYLRYGWYDWTILFRKLSSAPMITEFNDIPSSLVEEKTRNEELVSKSIFKIACKRLMKRLMNYLEKNFWLKETIKGSAKLTVVTENIKQRLHHNYKIPHSKIDVIPNGANTKLFRPLNMLNSREQLDIDRNDTVICFEGCFYAWQGLEYLIGTMPIILKKVPNTTLLIVGDEASTGNGDSKRKLIGMVKELDLEKKVIFTGAVPYEEVPIYLNASDVCVAYKKPRKSGYSPLKLYEYMACARPVVASKISGFEILEQNNAES